MRANIGRYHEPFEECVAPISAAALEAAFPPTEPSTPAPSASFEVEVSMGDYFQFLDTEKFDQDTSPVQTVHPSQTFFPRPIDIGPARANYYPAIPPSPLRETTSPTESGIGSLHTEDLGLVEGAEETREFAEDSEDEDRYTESTDEDEEEEYAAPGPSDKKSIQCAREQAGPQALEKSMPTGWRKSRVAADEDNFVHPPVPNPGAAREQADYNAGKQKWWSRRVLQPLLSASPKPLSKNAILSIIKKDLALEDDAWKAFYDEHLVGTFMLLIP